MRASTCRVLGDRGVRRRTLDGPAVRARLPAAPGRGRAAPQAHADARVRLRRHVDRGMRIAELLDAAKRERVSAVERRDVDARRRCCEEIRDAERFVLATHENPDGDALGSLAAMQRDARRARQGRGHVHARRRVPAALRVPLLRARRARAPSRPTTSTSARSSSWTAATSTATRRDVLKRDGGHILNIDHHHDNTRFGTVNHVVPEASCTAEIVWDLMHGLGVAADAGDRRGALRRPGHRHRQLHVREHRPARARDGGRADRRRRRRPRDLPAPVRGHPAGQARAAGARPDQRRALRRRAAHPHAPHARGLRADRRRGELLRGRRRPPALGRGHRGRRRSCATCSATADAAACARSRCAPPTTASTSRASPAPRAAAATARPPASRPTSSWPELVEFLRAQVRAAAPASSDGEPASAGRDDSSDGVLLVDKPAGVDLARRRRARAAAPRRAARGRPRRHARPVRHRACCSCSSGRATRVQRFLMALPKTLRDRSRGWAATSTTGDPEGEIAATGRVAARAARAAHRRLRQRPPAYSAVKVGGQRAYAPARRGEAVELPEREVDVHRFERSGARASARRSRSSARRAPTCAR